MKGWPASRHFRTPAFKYSKKTKQNKTKKNKNKNNPTAGRLQCSHPSYLVFISWRNFIILRSEVGCCHNKVHMQVVVIVLSEKCKKCDCYLLLYSFFMTHSWKLESNSYLLMPQHKLFTQTLNKLDSYSDLQCIQLSALLKLHSIPDH